MCLNSPEGRRAGEQRSGHGTRIEPARRGGGGGEVMTSSEAAEGEE